MLAPTRLRTEAPHREITRLPTHPVVALALTATAYLAVSLALHHRVLGDLAGSTTGWTSDAHLFVWWLNWFPWAAGHGQDPLFTTYQHYPTGVNAMWNTSVPLLAFLLAPITLTAGAVAAFNIGMILGPVVSGLALVLALRPYINRWLPRSIGGLLYAFSPFVVAHSSVGHINLVWAILPPILLWAVHAIFVTPGARPARAGMLLGGGFAVQTGIYSQTAALGGVALVVTAACLAIRRPQLAAERIPSVARAAAACVATYVALVPYPLYLLLAGPARPRGQIRDPATSGADVANVVVPSPLSSFRFGTGRLGEHLHSHPGEQGGYLGVALLIILVVAVVALRSALVRVTAAVGLVLLVLSFGINAVVLDHDTGIPLPWHLVERVPLLAEIEPVRFQVFVALCAAVIVAAWLDHLADRPPGPGRTAAVAATLLAAATWLPSNSQASVPATVPAFFTRSAQQHLDDRDVVETLPRITGEWVGGADPLLWQAASGMAYRTTGGYFIGSDPRHDLLLEAPSNLYQDVAQQISAGRPTSMAGAGAAARQLRAAGVTVVLVVDRPGIDSAPLIEWTRTVTGSPGQLIDDAWLFPLRRWA
ncbi:hypothetical protein [Pseudonocardia alaniniphila]|uniref:4-amino-4-deoxy-L-arabinose transferase-like glycosyltransferase n=1 Tax=Pseudonocardia alaniniphila TaxID=75291 RepID=A0ABS9TC81_9PSEU|nr:hypothetical protein [Pseudonocardia alaniniphila]MCH6166149.1 hypothetical protein [Pseudonocardia alaniniphila]